MKERITDKINELRLYISELEEIIPKSFEEYKELKEKAACERYVEKIAEATVDIAFLIIKYQRKEILDDDKSAFDILATSNVISLETGKAMRSAKGMKNIISHQYNKVDDGVVYESITTELLTDTKKFIEEIEIWFKKTI